MLQSVPTCCPFCLRSSLYSLDGSDDSEPGFGDDDGSGMWEMSFTLTRLESLHDLTNDGVDKQSKFAENGMSRKRIKDVAQNPSCECGCVISPALLYKICCAFWTLGKCAQDSLLWSLQRESRGKQIKYAIEGPLLTKHVLVRKFNML